MMWLAVRGLRNRAAGFVAIAVSTLLGAALIVVSGAFFETGIRLTVEAQRLADAPLIVVGTADYVLLDSSGAQTTDLRPFPERHRLDGDAVAEAAAVPGVASAVPVLLLDGVVAGPGGSAATVIQDDDSARFGLLADPAGGSLAAGGAAITTGLAEKLGASEGDTVQLMVAGTEVPLTLSALVGSRDEPDTLVIPHDLARTLAGGDAVDAIALALEPEADVVVVRNALGEALDGVTVLEGDGRGAAEYPAVASSRTPTIVTGAVFGGIVIVILATVISATVTLSVRQRAREISLLRATGATGRQARNLIVAEVMLAGVVGAALGVLAGWPLAAAIFSVVAKAGVVPPQLVMEVGLIPRAAALAITTGVLVLAALGAARPARRSRALEALQNAEVPGARMGVARWFFGIVFGLGAIALAILTALMPPSIVSATGGPAVLAGTTSAVLLAPVWLRLGEVLLRPALRLTARGLAPIASGTIRLRRAQFATVTACVALVTGIGLGNLAAQQIQLDAAGRAAVAPFRADLVVMTPGGATPELLARVGSVDGVEAASAVVSSGGWIETPHDSSHPDRPWSLLGISEPSAFRYQAASGSLGDLEGDTIALPVATAENLGLVVGDDLEFRFGDGALAALTVVATFEDRAGYERALLPAPLLAAHTTPRAVPMVAVVAAPGASVEDVRRSLTAELTDEPLVQVSGDVLAGTAGPALNVQALINTLMVVTAAAYAAIAVVNTLAVTFLSRRREFALLSLSGATRRQLRRLAASEVVVVSAVGVITGWVAAAAAVLPTAVAVGGTAFAPATAAVLIGLLVVVGVIVAPVTRHVVGRLTRHSPVTQVTAG